MNYYQNPNKLHYLLYLVFAVNDFVHFLNELFDLDKEGSNNINTDLLKELTVNSCTSKYEYDEYYRIESINKNNILKHHFEYLDKELGSLLQKTYNYFYNNNTLTDTFKKNYEYNNEQRLKEKKYYKNNNLKETINYLYDNDELVGIIMIMEIII